MAPPRQSDPARYLLPHLSRAKFGIQKTLDEAGFRAFLRGIRRSAEGRFERVGDGLGDRQALDPLRPPFRRDLLAGHSPDLLGIALEERAVQAIAEAIDQKILQRHFGRAMREPRLRVAHARAQALDESHVPNGVRIQLERIVEESAPIENSRQALSHQQYGIGRCRAKNLGREVSLLPLIADAQRLAGLRLALGHGQDLLPPAHDPIRFREEAVAAQVHAVPAVVDGLGYSADLGFRFEHDRRDVRASQHLERRGQAGRPGTHNDCNSSRLARRAHSVCPDEFTCLQSYRFQPFQMPGRR